MKFHLRKATEDDLRFLYNLRNEKAVRQASFSTSPIPFEQHARWFKKKLVGNDSVIFIVEIGGVPAGQVRFDVREDGGADGNIAISKNFRGKGYGTPIVKSASQHLFATFPKVHKIHVFIKPTNQASLKTFAKAGFRDIGSTIVKGEPCVELVLKR